MIFFHFLKTKISITFWISFLFCSFFLNQIINFNSFLIFIVLIGSLFIHEFFKGIVAFLFGAKANIVMSTLGGITFVDDEEKKLSFIQNIIIIFSGLLINVTIAFFSFTFLQRNGGNLSKVVFDLFFIFFIINSFLVFVNLMPIYPFDNGIFLSCVLEKCFNIFGAKLATLFSIFFGISLFLFMSLYQMFFLGFVFLLFSYENIKIFNLQKRITLEDIQPHFLKKFERIRRDLESSNLVEEDLIRELEEFMAQVNQGMLYCSSCKLLARHYLQLENYHKAYYFLEKAEKQLDNEGLDLLHYCAFMVNNYGKTLELSEVVFNHHIDYKIALFNSIAAASLKKIDLAFNWLDCSIREGLPISDEIFSLEEFQILKTHVIFQKYEENCAQNVENNS